jgi:3'-5' exoribonuclease
MIAGASLHDIGKLRELDVDPYGVTTYTVEGNLFGHLFIGPMMVDEACRELGIDPTKEKVMLLKHMIASHHKKQDQGAVRPPATAEAYTLAVLDDLDSALYKYNDEFKKLEPGTMTTQLNRDFGTAVYKMNN